MSAQQVLVNRSQPAPTAPLDQKGGGAHTPAVRAAGVWRAGKRMSVSEDLTKAPLRHCWRCDVYWVGGPECWCCGRPCQRCSRVEADRLPSSEMADGADGEYGPCNS